MYKQQSGETWCKEQVRRDRHRIAPQNTRARTHTLKKKTESKNEKEKEREKKGTGKT